MTSMCRSDSLPSRSSFGGPITRSTTSSAPRPGSRPYVPQDGDGLGVLPVVEDRLQHVDVGAAGTRLEEAAAHNVAAIEQPARRAGPDAQRPRAGRTGSRAGAGAPQGSPASSDPEPPAMSATTDRATEVECFAPRRRPRPRSGRHRPVEDRLLLGLVAAPRPDILAVQCLERVLAGPDRVLQVRPRLAHRRPVDQRHPAREGFRVVRREIRARAVEREAAQRRPRGRPRFAASVRSSRYNVGACVPVAAAMVAGIVRGPATRRSGMPRRAATEIMSVRRWPRTERESCALAVWSCIGGAYEGRAPGRP